ncbi:phosphatidylserine decarboxylase 1, partial [Coemansia sp. RSA 2703]
MSLVFRHFSLGRLSTGRLSTGRLPSTRLPSACPSIRPHIRHYVDRPSHRPNDKRSSTSWYWIPVGLGIAYIGFQRLYHIETDRRTSEPPAVPGVAVTGPWQLHVLSALPLKAMSRFFGSFNEIEIPTPLRAPLLRIYATLFSCRLDEMKDPDLSHYPNLATFFYRELRDGARPVDMNPDTALVSPSDGKILHFGVVGQREVEQVKGLTYSLDAFFGKPDSPPDSQSAQISDSTLVDASLSHSHNAAADDEFAVVNGIPYTLDSMIGATDALAPASQSLGSVLRDHERLYFCVIYLAPGDYHRFHSPANWV